MNEEVKELLSRLKRCTGEQYLIEIDCGCSKLLLDYITNLQNKYENQVHRYKNLKEYAINLQKEIEELKQDNIIGCEKFIKQKQRIDEAIEYIKENKDKYYHDWGEDDGSYDTYLDETEIDKLSNILNGGDE